MTSYILLLQTPINSRLTESSLSFYFYSWCIPIYLHVIYLYINWWCVSNIKMGKGGQVQRKGWGRCGSASCLLFLHPREGNLLLYKPTVALSTAPIPYLNPLFPSCFSCLVHEILYCLRRHIVAGNLVEDGPSNLQTIVPWTSLVWPIACLEAPTSQRPLLASLPRRERGQQWAYLPPETHLHGANSVQSHLKSSEFLLTELVAFLTTYNATEPGMFYPLALAHIRTIEALI